MQRQYVVLVLAATTMLSLGSACKCRQESRQPVVAPVPVAPRVSPVGNRPSSVVVDPLASFRADAAADASKPDASPRVTKPAPVDAAVARGRTDAQVAAERAARARATTEKAVDAGLNQAKGRLQACFRQHGASSGEVKIQLRLRSGYVTTAGVSGVGGPVATCLDGVLRGLKFSGVANQSATIDRTFKFAR